MTIIHCTTPIHLHEIRLSAVAAHLLGDFDRRLLVELLTGDLERDRRPGERDFLELFVGDRERDLDRLRVLEMGLRDRRDPLA